MKRLALSLLASPLIVATLSAQDINGSLFGYLADPRGLPVAGGTVTLRNINTDARRSAQADERGAFEFLSMAPGSYDLVAEQSGFKKLVSSGHVISPTERLSVGTLTLELGEVNESVVVSGRLETVQTVSSERGQNISRYQLENLQLLSRDPMELVVRMPGFASGETSTFAAQDPSALRLLTVGGLRATNKNFTVDGVSAKDFRNGNASTVAITADAVEEVQVQAANFQAEYGRTSGPSINIITRAGSQNFHGSVYYYRRHEKLNANGFFNNRNGVGKQPNREQTRGLTIGGPIYIPGLFNTDKRKLFFFFSESQAPATNPAITHQITMPTPLERQGDFSESLDQTGRLIVIRDPATGAAFPENRIPASRLNPLGMQLLDVFPQPNATDPQRRFNFQQSGFRFRRDTREEVVRVDYQMSDRIAFNGRYIQDKHDALRNQFANWSLIDGRNARPGKNVSLASTQTLSTTLVNQATFGYSRAHSDLRPEDPADLAKIQRSTYGVQLGQLNPQNNPDDLLPQLNFGATLPSLPTIDPGRELDLQQGFTAIDNVSKVYRSHILKAGIYYERALEDITQPGGFGRLNFAVNANNPNETNHPFANALLGNFNTYMEESSIPGSRLRFTNLEWYVQDTWRASRTLTLEYGLRFYWHPPQTEADDQLAGFDRSSFDPSRTVRLYEPFRDPQQGLVGRDPATGALVPNALVGAIVPGSGDVANGIVTVSSRDLVKGGFAVAPRFGFAYDPAGDGKTAIRGGFGIFYDRLPDNFFQQLAVNPPLIFTPTIFFGSLPSLPSSTGVVFPQTIRGIAPFGELPTVMNFSVGVQRRVANLFVVDVAYVGSLGRHLTETRDYNTTAPGTNFLRANENPTAPNTPLAPAFLRPYRGYQSIIVTDMGSNSNYHSLQAGFTRTFGNRFNFQGNWTYSKAMDFASFDATGRSVLLDKSRDYAKSSFDVLHILHFNWIYQLPGLSSHLGGSRILAHIFDDWRLTGNAQIQGGVPRDITLTAPNDFTGSTEGARVTVVGALQPGSFEKSFNTWFDPNAVGRPRPGQFGVTQPGDVDYGNAPRDIVREPGINNWNIALSKIFRLYEDHRLQFSGEFYNFPNHTQYRTLDRAARFSAAGQQTNATLGQVITARDARVIQLALRYNF